jgi:uncharacterized protein (DUF362 family)
VNKAKVAIVKGPTKPAKKEIDAQVRRAVELAGGLAGIVKPGDTVLIKPNVCALRTVESAAITDPRVCKAITDMVRELGANPIIGESTSVGADTEEAFQEGGYYQLREEGYNVINLKKEGTQTTKISIPRGKSLKEVFLPNIVLDAKVIISVAKMKTHDQTNVTLSLKNMKGILTDKGKRSLHRTFGVFQGVADLCTVIKPNFALIDGIVGMEGLGPTDGEPVEMGLIIAGKDPVAVDTVTSLVMGFEHESEGCIAASAQADIGTDDLNKIEVVGEPIAKVRRQFKRVEEAYAAIPFPEGFQLLVDEKACSSCRNMVTEVLMALKDANQLDRLARWTVIAGRIDKLPDVDRERLLLVGACTAKYWKEGVYVEGCSPNLRDVLKGMRGMGVDLVTGIDVDSIDAMPDEV